MDEAQDVRRGTKEVNMDEAQGSLDRESWMGRARAVRVVPAVSQERQPELRSPMRAAPAAWDPFEVWLHRIHRPRLRRAAEQ